MDLELWQQNLQILNYDNQKEIFRSRKMTIKSFRSIIMIVDTLKQEFY